MFKNEMSIFISATVITGAKKNTITAVTITQPALNADFFKPLISPQIMPASTNNKNTPPTIQGMYDIIFFCPPLTNPKIAFYILSFNHH